MVLHNIEEISVTGNVHAVIDSRGVIRGCSTVTCNGSVLHLSGEASNYFYDGNDIIGSSSYEVFGVDRNYIMVNGNVYNCGIPTNELGESVRLKSLRSTGNATLAVSSQFIDDYLTIHSSDNSSIQISEGTFEQVTLVASGNARVKGNHSRVNKLYLTASGIAQVHDFAAVTIPCSNISGLALTSVTRLQAIETIKTKVTDPTSSDDMDIDHCKICLEKKVMNHVILPCFHMVACDDCLGRIGGMCPVCRAVITEKKLVYRC